MGTQGAVEAARTSLVPWQREYELPHAYLFVCVSGGGGVGTRAGEAQGSLRRAGTSPFPSERRLPAALALLPAQAALANSAQALYPPACPISPSLSSLHPSALLPSPHLFLPSCKWVLTWVFMFCL